MAEQKKAPPGKVALNGNTNKPTIFKERQAVDNYAEGLEETE